MYADFFGLRELPFNNTPDPRFFFSTPDHEEALASLIYVVGEMKGFISLTGAPGTGKTLLSRLMLAHYGQRISYAEVGTSHLCAENLLVSVCQEFGLSARSQDGPVRLTAALHDFLIEQFAMNKPTVLLLDEAQHLSMQALEELRLVSSLDAHDAKLLQIVLIGQPGLRNTLGHPSMQQLAQRLFRTVTLPALDRKQTGAYIAHRLEVAGLEGSSPFADGAVERVWHVSRGVPRVINTLCDNALLSAFSDDRRVVDETVIDNVATMNAQLIEHLQVDADAATERLSPKAESHTATTSPPVSPYPMYFPHPQQSGASIAEGELRTRVAILESRIVELASRSGASQDVSQQTLIAERLANLDQKLTRVIDGRVIDGKANDGRANDGSNASAATARDEALVARLALLESRYEALLGGSSQVSAAGNEASTKAASPSNAIVESARRQRKAETQRALDRLRAQTENTNRLIDSLRDRTDSFDTSELGSLATRDRRRLGHRGLDNLSIRARRLVIPASAAPPKAFERRGPEPGTDRINQLREKARRSLSAQTDAARAVQQMDDIVKLTESLTVDRDRVDA